MDDNRFFVGYGLELSRLVPLIIFHLKKKYLCKTEAEVKEAWFPGDIGYATRVPSDMLILTIVLCYSIIAPIIIPFGAVYFGLGWLILRNQVSKDPFPFQFAKVLEDGSNLIESSDIAYAIKIETKDHTHSSPSFAFSWKLEMGMVSDKSSAMQMLLRFYFYHLDTCQKWLEIHPTAALGLKIL